MKPKIESKTLRANGGLFVLGLVVAVAKYFFAVDDIPEPDPAVVLMTTAAINYVLRHYTSQELK